MICIKTALEQAAQQLAASSDMAALEAEILLCWILQKQRSYLRAWPNKLLDTPSTDRFWIAVNQRLQGHPIAYIIGHREFWSRDFQVTSDVLIPRPDTELLIDCALKLIPQDQPYNIIDLGTGSGIIGITLAAERRLAQVTATDISLAALTIAQHNAKQHQVERIQFYVSDWFNNLPNTLFNLVISNPPYIAEADPHLHNGDLRFEPQTALTAPDNGLAYIKTLAAHARRHLQADGHLLIEHGYNQSKTVQTIFNDYGYRHVQTYNDLGGQPRVTYGQWIL